MLTEDDFKHLLFSILTATVTASLGLSLSMPRASAITTCPKQPSPSGLPRVNLHKHTTNITEKLLIEVICAYLQTSTHPDRRFQSPCRCAYKCCLSSSQGLETSPKSVSIYQMQAFTTFNRIISELRVHVLARCCVYLTRRC